MNQRIRFLVSIGLTYLLLGLTSAMVTNQLEPGLVQMGLRLTVFGVSVVIFILHVRREVHRYRNPPRTAALGTTGAVLIGTFSIAVYANLSAVQESGELNTSLLSTLLIWPLVTGSMAFGVAFVMAKVIAGTIHKK